jgi:phosphate/sulfate permease
MYWWQWALQIIGAWFCLALVTLVLWHLVISVTRKLAAKRTARIRHGLIVHPQHKAR